MPVTTPNMNLLKPVVGTDSGFTWETSDNANADTIDSHDHTSGKGAQITPGAININSALSFNNQVAQDIQAVVFTPVASLATLNAIYCIGADLYYNDSDGNAVQITKSGAVNATSSGISDGTATASFAAGVLVVNSAALTPANIQVGSVLLGNNVASSNFLTLSPPAAMPANYTLTLPSVPASTLLVTLDSSGNFGTVANATIADTLGQAMTSTGANPIGTAMTSTGANAVANSRTRATGTTVGAGGVAIRAINLYSNTTTSPTSLGNVTITTSGRPVLISLYPQASSSSSVGLNSVTSSGGKALFNFIRSSTGIGSCSFSMAPVSALPTQTLTLSPAGAQSLTVAGTVSTEMNQLFVPPASVALIDTPAAGTYTYSISGSLGLGTVGSLEVSVCNLIVYEL